MFARETEPALVADGVVGLGTELVNWYLVEDDGRVTIVDAGAPRYRPQLHRGLALLGRRPADVAAVLTEVDIPGAPRARSIRRATRRVTLPSGSSHAAYS
jgi:hypothetical protein